MFFSSMDLKPADASIRLSSRLSPPPFRLFPQQGEALGMFRRGVGDAEGEGLVLVVSQDAIRSGLGKARLGKEFASKGGIEGARLEVGIGELSLARAIGVETLVVPRKVTIILSRARACWMPSLTSRLLSKGSAVLR